jgi:hypothetical protein
LRTSQSWYIHEPQAAWPGDAPVFVRDLVASRSRFVIWFNRSLFHVKEKRALSLPDSPNTQGKILTRCSDTTKVSASDGSQLNCSTVNAHPIHGRLLRPGDTDP